jgi:hypothetical protein
VDTNGTKYNFYIYTSAGSSAQDYILFINELQGVTPVSAMSLSIPASLPMAVPLEVTSKEYQYTIYNPSCTSVYYTGSFVDPTNPTYITLTTGTSQAVIYNMTNATGACTLNTSANPYRLACAASDSKSQVYRYVLDIYKQINVIGSTSLVSENVFNTSAFSFNTTLPINASYSYSLFAYAFIQYDPLFLVNGGLLNFTKVRLSAPLLGFFAFLLMLTLIKAGEQTGKPIILLLLVDCGLFIVSILNLVQVPTSVAVAFIIIGAIFSVWSIKVR